MARGWQRMEENICGEWTLSLSLLMVTRCLPRKARGESLNFGVNDGCSVDWSTGLRWSAWLDLTIGVVWSADFCHRRIPPGLFLLKRRRKKRWFRHLRLRTPG